MNWESQFGTPGTLLFETWLNQNAGSVWCTKQGSIKTLAGRLIYDLEREIRSSIVQLISSLVLSCICSVPLVHLTPDFDIFKPEDVRDCACVPDKEKL